MNPTKTEEEIRVKRDQLLSQLEERPLMDLTRVPPCWKELADRISTLNWVLNERVSDPIVPKMK